MYVYSLKFGTKGIYRQIKDGGYWNFSFSVSWCGITWSGGSFVRGLGNPRRNKPVSWDPRIKYCGFWGTGTREYIIRCPGNPSNLRYIFVRASHVYSAANFGFIFLCSFPNFNLLEQQLLGDLFILWRGVNLTNVKTWNFDFGHISFWKL